MLVDLHTHTYLSDGTMSPKEIVEKAKKNNVGIISITDHNKINSWNEFKEVALENNITPIKGVEINVAYKGKILHLLAYNFNNTENLLKLINKADLEMEQMSIDLVDKLSQDNDRVSLIDYKEYEYNRLNGGWKGLHYLFDKNVTKKLFDGFNYYRDYGCGYELYDFPQLSEVCKKIKEANGYSVLAHPYEYYKGLSKDELVLELEFLREEGIDGIECYYPTHTKLIEETCVEFCKKYNLLITCGSDDHGEFGKEAKVLDHSIGCLKVEFSHLNIEKLIK
ncbi:MAG: PHP domain-containing protein [Romboutsia sp.]